MKIDKDKIKSELNLIPFGSKGWVTNSELSCPECNRKGKFGINVERQPGGVHCFYCEYSESVFKFLKRIGRTDLISFEQEVSINQKLKLINEEIELSNDDLPEVKLPRGYERINFDEYLDNRNFKDYQYEQFEVGITNHFLERKLKNYLIFIIKQKGRRVGWLARSKYSYEWHKKNLEDYRAGKCTLQLRYRNSEGTDFGKLLGGFDEITDETEEVILVEGLFDKTNISNLLNTESSHRLKVLCTFGNKVSDEQLKLLRSTKIKIINLMYDYNTIEQQKRYSTEISRWFESYVCEIPLMYNENGEEIDPGNISKKYLDNILLNKVNFLYFYNSKLRKFNN